MAELASKSKQEIKDPGSASVEAGRLRGEGCPQGIKKFMTHIMRLPGDSRVGSLAEPRMV